MTTLTHRGYQGSIEYEDGTIVIQLLHIEDFITATCDSAKEVEATFKDLVDDYLTTCAELGREPQKPYKGSLNIRMEPELHREIAMAAAGAGVSLNAWIVGALQISLSSGGNVATPIVFGDASDQSGIANLRHVFSLGGLLQGPRILAKGAKPPLSRVSEVEVLVNNIATTEEAWQLHGYGVSSIQGASRKAAS